LSKPERQPSSSRALVLGLLAFLLETPVISVLIGRPWLPGGWTVLFHAAASVVMFFAPPREKGYLRPTRHWGEPLCLLTLVAPGAGCLLGLSLLALHPDAHADRDAYRFEEDEAEDVNWLAGQGAASDIREQLADARDVIPAADALLGRDPALKRGAIEVLAQIRSPEAISWLLRARTDPDPEIRFYATSAVTRVKRDYDAEMGAAQAEVVQRPGDLSKQLALERIRYEYARSGLLERATAVSMLGQCRERLGTLADHDVDALGLLFLAQREIDPAAALEALERLLRVDSPTRSRWLRERVSLAFELERYGDVRKLVAQAGERLAEGEGLGQREAADWRSAALWWSHG